MREPSINIISNSERLVKIRDNISKNLDAAHLRSAKTYNTRSKAIEFRVGQEVYRRNFQQSSFVEARNAKFCHKFLKCRVRKRVGNCLYELEKLNGEYIGKFHAKDIKP